MLRLHRLLENRYYSQFINALFASSYYYFYKTNMSAKTTPD